MPDREDALDAQNLAIRRRCRDDPAFLAIWQDFIEIREGLERLRSRPTPQAALLADYVRLERELREELLKLLARP